MQAGGICGDGGDYGAEAAEHYNLAVAQTQINPHAQNVACNALSGL